MGAQNEGHGGSDQYTNPIYTIGKSHLPTHTSLGDMYGIGYTHSNFWGTGDARPDGWGQYVAADGDIRIILQATNGRIWASGDVRAPIYYDKNNTGYYLDPASTSKLNALETHGRHYAKNGVHVQGDWLRVDGDSGVYFQSHGTGIHSVTADSGQYGSVSTYGNEGGWEGYSIGGKYVLMSDKDRQVGLYNDIDNRWLFLFDRGSADNTARFWNPKSGSLNLRYQHTNGTRYASYDGDSNWDFYSDRRIKKNIELETNILNRLMNLDVKNYQFINQDKTEKEIGFIAQEVETYFPSLVSELDDPNYEFKVKALGYSSFGVLAVGGIKELKLEKDAEIKALKQENESLKTQLSELIKRIEALENN